MLSLRGNKQNFLKTAVLPALAILLLLFCQAAFAADTMVLWNGGIKKGDIAVRISGGVQQAALDQAASALGLMANTGNGTFAVTLDGKKLEAWNASNVLRASGTIISSSVPVTFADGHWWVDSSAMTQALGIFYTSIRKQAAFELKPTGESDDKNQPQPVVIPPAAPAVKPEPQKPASASADSLQPAAPEEPEPVLPALKIAPAFSGSKRPVVVVDAGHGGHDPGASGNGLREKDINLKAALQLGEILRLYGVDARLSRKTDVYLKLGERTAFANQNNADVFVSLHCNAAGKGGGSASGLEYYIMASPSDKDALNLAIAENKEISAGMDSAKDAQNADKKTRLLLKILGDMQQNDKITESTALTEVLHKNARGVGLPIRKVKQAPFFVLRGAGMPAVLVEMGYITNAGESRKLASASYRETMMRSVAQGVVQYIKDHPTQVK